MCVQTRPAEAAEKATQVLPAAAQMLPPPPVWLPPPPPQPRHTALPATTAHPATSQAPPVPSNHQHHHDSSSMQTSGPVQQRNSNRKSRWDEPPAPVEGQGNSQSNRQQPEQHAARQSMPHRDASPEQLTQHLQSLSLQPATQRGGPSSCPMRRSIFSSNFKPVTPYSCFAGASMSVHQASNQSVALRSSQPAPLDAAATLQVFLVQPHSDCNIHDSVAIIVTPCGSSTCCHLSGYSAHGSKAVTQPVSSCRDSQCLSEWLVQPKSLTAAGSGQAWEPVCVGGVC